MSFLAETGQEPLSVTFLVVNRLCNERVVKPFHFCYNTFVRERSLLFELSFS